MKRILISLVAALLFVSMLLTVPVSASLSTVVWIEPENYKPALEDYAYSFAILGDTQILVREDAGTYAANKDKKSQYTKQLYDWLIDNVEEKKIAYVMGLGDICEMSYEPKEWAVAQEQIMRLNGVVPYSLVRGNHDDSMWFMREMGVENPDYMDSFDGAYGKAREQMLNNYRYLRVGGVSYLIMVLDYYPTDAVLEWANQVIADHPHHRVIITTHAYLMGGLTTIKNYDSKYAPHGGNSGEDIWQKLGKKHENIFMIISGHVGVDGIDVATRQGVNKNKVMQILIDPQDLDEEAVRTKKEDPTGMVALFYFSKDGKSIGLEYYSTIRNRYVKLFEDKRTIEPYVDVFGDPETEAPETTAIPETTADVVDTTASTTVASDMGGCKGALGFVALPVTISTLGAALAVSKKRKR